MFAWSDESLQQHSDGRVRIRRKYPALYQQFRLLVVV